MVDPERIAWAFGENGHTFIVEQLAEPKRVGNYLRPYRLWMDGQPASGGQWHYTIENAIARADYLLRCEYSDRIRWLECRVGTLERELHELRKDQ